MTATRAPAPKAEAAPAPKAGKPAPPAPARDNGVMQGLLRSGAVRAKLQVGGVDDPQEREADAVADRVMRSADGGCCSSCASGGGCEEDAVRRSPEGGAGRGGGAVGGAAAAGIRGLAGGGEPLPPRLRGFFEPRLGADLGHVRVHTGPQAAASASAIQARAFAHGSDIAFGAGQWRPDSADGRRLIAHELAHVAAGHTGVRRVTKAAKAVQAAIDSGDPGQVGDLASADLQKATPAQKVALIRIILDKGGATHRLDLLWQGVPDAEVEANIDLWKATWEKHAGSMENHPRKTQFARDVADVANAMLDESEAACQMLLTSYGLTEASPSPGQSTADRSEALSSVQKGAVDVLGAQLQLKRLYAIKIPTDPKYLGFGSSMKGSSPFELGVEPLYASPEGADLWKKTAAAVRQLMSAVDGYLEAFPELYPLVHGGRSSAKDAYTDTSRTKLAADKPLDAVEQGLRSTIAAIQASRGPAIHILARERKLGPVEQQLLAGARMTGGRDWHAGPIWTAMTPVLTAKTGFFSLETGLMLGFQLALAVMSGGIGNLIMSGFQAAMSSTEAKILQTASDATLTAENAVVSKQEVATAELMAAVDAAFIVLDLAPGFRQARQTWGAARGSARLAQESAEALRKQVLRFESRLTEKAERAELAALRKEMQQSADLAAKSLAETKEAAAKAAEGEEKILANAELRAAEEAVASAKRDLKAADAMEKGEILAVELSGRRYSLVPGRGLVICASPCSEALEWMTLHAKAMLDEVSKVSKLAGDELGMRIVAVKKQLKDLNLRVKDLPSDSPEFRRAAVQANSMIEDLKLQRQYLEIRFPASKTSALSNREWLAKVKENFMARRALVEKVDDDFFAALGDPSIGTAARGAHEADLDEKVAGALAQLETVLEMPDPPRIHEDLVMTVPEAERAAVRAENAAYKAAAEKVPKAKKKYLNREGVLESLETSLRAYERELRGQRDLIIDGGEMKAFSDKVTGELLYPPPDAGQVAKAASGKKAGGAAAEGVSTPRPDYIAEFPDRIVVGDSKGTADIMKAKKQIEGAIQSKYIKDLEGSGKRLEFVIYLDFADLAKRKYFKFDKADKFWIGGRPPIIHEWSEATKTWVPLLVDGKTVRAAFN